jgi:outer membrane protein assembly factor BamB
MTRWNSHPRACVIPIRRLVNANQLMSLYRIEPPERPPQRSPWLITPVLLVVVLALGGALWFFSGGTLGLRLVITPTPTATPGTPATATPDYLATRIAEDQATQIAYGTFLPPETQVIRAPTIGGAVATATPVNVNLPWVDAGGADSPLASAPTPLAESPLLTPPPILLPGVHGDANQPTDSPLATPTGPIVLSTDTPTPTETPALPTETPTPSATATITPLPVVFQVATLRAYVLPPPTPATVWARPAPANGVTPDATLVVGAEIQLLGRDGSGEWVYFCCINNGQPRWVRQASAPPADNSLPANATPSATPNDVRWLPTQPWPGNVAPPAVATPIPPQDFPRFHYDRANSGRVPTSFADRLNPLWSVESSPAQTAGRVSAPPLVAGQYVIVASADGNLYGFDRTIGNQIWKYALGTTINFPLTVQDNIIYYAGNDNRVTAIQVGSPNPLWQVNLAIPNVTTSALPATGLLATGSHLFIGVSNGTNYRILQIDRAQGGILNNFDVGGTQPRELALGNRLLYVAGAQLWALDIDNFELIWTRSDLTNLAVPPLYTAAGVSAAAELYVATGDTRTHALEANTGAQLHTYEGGGEAVTGLALGDNHLYVTGSAFLKAYDRRGNGLFWRISTNGDARWGALVTPGQVILVAVNGVVQLINPATQQITTAASVPTGVLNPPAVSGANLYVPGENGRLYGFTQ